MPLDNETVGSPAGSISKTPVATANKLRNLSVLTAAALVLGGIGMGVGIKYEASKSVGSADRIESNTAAALLVHETAGSGFDDASSFDILTGLTHDGTIFIQSGGLLVGPDGSPNITASGSDITLKGTASGAKLIATPTTGSAAIVLYGGAKGSHICVRDSDGAGWTMVSWLNGTITDIVAPAGQCP